MRVERVPALFVLVVVDFMFPGCDCCGRCFRDLCVFSAEESREAFELPSGFLSPDEFRF